MASAITSWKSEWPDAHSSETNLASTDDWGVPYTPADSFLNDPNFKGVNFLEKLPREVRDQIWRLLLHRQATIKPGLVGYYGYSEYRIGKTYFGNQTYRKRYRYMWNERPQVDKDIGRGFSQYVPLYQGEDVDLTVAIVREPTRAQIEFITGDGGGELPFTFDGEGQKQTGCNVVTRGKGSEQFRQIVSHVKMTVPSFDYLAIMRVNKQALAECREILYGENSFVFETHSHANSELEHYQNEIPCMPYRNGNPQNPQRIEENLKRMFSKDEEVKIPKFVARSQMLRFFRRIGPVNAALLTKVTIEGTFKTAYECSQNPDLGFGRVLDILIPIMKHTCPELRELTLEYGQAGWCRGSLWDIDPENKAGKSDTRRIDDIVGGVVSKLPNLKVLQLGGYQSFRCLMKEKDNGEAKPVEKYVDEWGTATRWMTFVKKRAEKHEMQRLEKMMASRPES